MQVDYREKLPAGGKFPGGFRKREGAPNEKEVLTMRMIDRPIRPLFPDGFIDEVQIQCWVMSHDGENDTDVIAGTAAAAALAISDAPSRARSPPSASAASSPTTTTSPT
jgi:polyribonucleotide nucleotidyltransferase